MYRYLKRALALVVSLSLCFTVVLPTKANQADLVDIDRAAELLYLTQVIPAKTITEEEAGQTVTRADFVFYTAKLLHMNENVDAEYEYFYDLDGHWAKNLVHYFVSSGLIAVNQERLFEPERAITREEAVKILVQALGYGKMAEASGGYPAGYLKIASQIDLLWSGCDELPVKTEIFHLLERALEIPLYEPIVFSGSGVTYSEERGTTILSLYHSIYSDKGFLRSADNMSLDHAQRGEGLAVIGDYQYTYGADSDINLQSYLGLKVEVFYSKAGSQDERVLKLLRDTGLAKTADINARDVKELDEGYRLFYCREGRKTDGRYQLDRGIQLLYNGELETENIRYLLNHLQNGSVRLIDVNEDGKYEYGIIKNYVDVVVSYVDTKNQIIFDRLGGEPLDINEFETAVILDAERKKTEFSSIVSNYVLSVARGTSGRYFEVLISPYMVSGSISAIKQEAPEMIAIVNETEYSIKPEAFSRTPVSPGDHVQFYINSFGEVACIDVVSEQPYRYAYLCQAAFRNDGMERVLMLKLFDQEGGMKRLDVSPRVKIDEITYKEPEKALLALPGSYGTTLNPQMVRLQTDERGQVIRVDTEYCSSEESKFSSLTSTVPSGTYVYASSPNKRIGLNTLVDSSTCIIFAPSKAAVMTGEYDDEEFMIVPYNELELEISVNAIGYKTNLTDAVEDALVVFGRSNANTYVKNKLFTVSEVLKVLDSDGTAAWALEGITNGSQTTLMVLDDYYSQFMELSLSEGDIIAYSVDVNHKINDIKLIYDMSQGGEPYTQIGSRWATPNRYVDNYASFSKDFSCSFMYAAYQTGSAVKGIYNLENDAYTACDEAFNIASVSITVVDTRAPSGSKVFVGTADDVRTVYDVGKNECSMLFAHYGYWGLKDVVIYNHSEMR